jgi:hypothetical protein
MTLGQHRDTIAHVLAAAIGAGLVIALVAMARPAGGRGGVAAAALRFTAAPDGAVALTPAAPRALLASGPLRPGDHAAGTLRLRNQTGSRLAVGLRAEPSSTALDGLARVRVVAGGRVLADNTLQMLRRGTPGRLRLAPGAGTRVRVVASIPADAESGYEGARVAVRLVPEHRRAR